MKNAVGSILSFGLVVAVCSVCTAASQPSKARPGTKLSAAQLTSLVKADLDACEAKVPVVPRESVQAITPDRVAKTLHGVWRGRVWGEFPKELIAKDGFVNVDYYWIIDTERHEALVLEQLSSTRSAPQASSKAPAWSFLTCGREGYLPKHPRQVHEFHKISDTLDGVGRILETSTGLKMAEREVSLSAAWQALVEKKYFDTKRFGAYAGGLFKPLEITKSTDKAGNPVLSLSFQAEYRGAGDTAAKFETGVPIIGKESAGFIGVSTPSGDYLVSSLENGVVWAKSDAEAALINMTMDKVVIGPLAR